MVPPASHGVSRVPRYSGSCSLTSLFAYATLTLSGYPSHNIRLRSVNAKCSPQPPYLDVSVQAVSLIYLCIQYMITEVCSVGLLHSEIHGSKRTYRSPWLIAVNRVLLRLPMPRHSPCALFSFTICFLLS